MNNKYVKSLLLAAVCSTGVLLAAEDDATTRSINTTIDAFSADKQRLEAEANSFISQGNEFFVASNYKDAIDRYVSAIGVFDLLKENSPYFAEQIVKTQEMIAKAYYYMAQEIALKAQEESNSGEFEHAIAYCREAIEIYPACAEEMNERIALYEKMYAASLRRNQFADSTVIPDLESRAYKVAVLLKQAKLLYYTHQYELARKRYQEVLLLDKFCAEAIQGLRATALQLERAGRDRARITHKKMAAEAAWEGTTPIIQRDSSDVRGDEFNFGGEETVTSKTSISEDAGVAAMREKLRSIVLPKVTFSGDSNGAGTPLPVVLEYLRMRSTAYDPEGQGINFFLYYPETKQQEDEFGLLNDDAFLDPAGLGSGLGRNNRDNAPLAGGFDDYGDEEYEDEEEEAETEEEKGPDYSRYPEVNMDVQNKSLLEIIEVLAESAGLKYKIEPHAVIFAPKDAPMDDMQIKIFMFDETMLDDGPSDPESLKRKLMMYNVEFPVGSNVMYDSRFRSLIVLNTPENLNKVADALLEIRQLEPPPLVQIQVKFVEVEQSDLKELGFIQSLGRPNGDAGQTNGRLQFDENDTTLYNSGKNTFTYSRSTNGYNYSLTINAINQLDSKDVLSSPKVLTSPNKTVSIKMTSERYFEWDYEEGEFEISTSDGVTTYSYTPPWPEFEMQELGISMEITPSVDTKNRLITLDVHPWIRTLVGWTEYQYYVSSDDNDGPSTGQLETMKRPIVAERTTLTNVVIGDNETVVIGGIIKDYTVLVDDKIPILGDIPLLGRFFTSKSSSIKKTNLLIFVTARMLKPDGSPYFSSDSRGRPTEAGIGDIY